MQAARSSAIKRVMFLRIVTVLAILAFPQLAVAGSRLAATGGVMQIEGSAGGGIVPWAVIAGLGSRDEIGASAFCTQVEPADFELRSCGMAVGLYDRVELSFARQSFDLGTTVPGESIEQRIFGLKFRLLGDAVFDQDTWVPQVSLGLQYKKNEDFDFVPQLLGAVRDEGIDYYLSATKLWLAGPFGRSLLLNATLRATRANQLGILGFGGDRRDSHSLHPELSAGLFLTDDLVVGLEYRDKPDNLSVFAEDGFADAFVAWVPFKNLSVTAAYADLGNIADKSDQKGWYLSLQGSF